MVRKKIKAYTLLMLSLISIITGILFISYGTIIIEALIIILGIQIIVMGASAILLSLIGKNNEKLFEVSIKALVNINFGIVVIVFNQYILTSITLIFLLYIFLIAMTNFATYLLYKLNNVNKGLGSLITFLINIIFLIILIINPQNNLKYIVILVGIYLILNGIKDLFNFITEIMPVNTTNKIKTHIEIPLPVIFSLIVSKRLIRLINEMLKVETIDKFNYDKLNKEPDLYVIIQLAKEGSASFGHMEVAFNNKIYSYGNYNNHSRKFGNLIGEGIILTADKDKYIKYCVTKRNRYLIEFGIVLTRKQKEQVIKRINQLVNNNTIDYYPDESLKDQGLLDGEFNDMSSEIYKYANGEFKKIISGKNKVFFVLKNNCAMVANYILKATGKKIISINGIITPGTYYDYLNNRFMMHNTNVITRKIYTNKDFK